MFPRVTSERILRGVGVSFVVHKQEGDVISSDLPRDGFRVIRTRGKRLALGLTINLTRVTCQNRSR